MRRNRRITLLMLMMTKKTTRIKEADDNYMGRGVFVCVYIYMCISVCFIVCVCGCVVWVLCICVFLYV